MMSGRDALAGQAMWKWADEGEQWLREHFGEKLEFHTTVDVDKREVTLTVYEKVDAKGVRSQNVGPGRVVFQTTEPVQYFVSRLTATKIILIAG